MAKYSIKYRKKGTKTWKKFGGVIETMPKDIAFKKIEDLKSLKGGKYLSGISYHGKYLSGDEFEYKLKKWGK